MSLNAYNILVTQRASGRPAAWQAPRD